MPSSQPIHHSIRSSSRADLKNNTLQYATFVLLTVAQQYSKDLEPTPIKKATFLLSNCCTKIPKRLPKKIACEDNISNLRPSSAFERSYFLSFRHKWYPWTPHNALFPTKPAILRKAGVQLIWNRHSTKMQFISDFASSACQNTVFLRTGFSNLQLSIASWSPHWCSTDSKQWQHPPMKWWPRVE